EGAQEDINTYRRVFGPPPDDKNLSRMQALMMESHCEFQDAHKFWKNYHDEIAKSSDRWPGEQARRARAIIWSRMADVAIDHEVAEDDEEDELFDEFMEIF